MTPAIAQSLLDELLSAREAHKINFPDGDWRAANERIGEVWRAVFKWRLDLAGKGNDFLVRVLRDSVLHEEAKA